MADTAQNKPGRPQPDLKEFVDLGRSSVNSHFRALLAQKDVGPSGPVFEKLKSFLSVEFVSRFLKFTKAFFSFRRKFQGYNYAQGETCIFLMAQSPAASPADDTGAIKMSIAGDWGTGTKKRKPSRKTCSTPDRTTRCIWAMCTTSGTTTK